MKVLFATLLVVGLAAASRKSIFDTLKTKLQQDVRTIKEHTQQLLQQVSAHVKEDIDTVTKVPFVGFKKVIENLSQDAENVIKTSYSDINNVKQHIQTAMNELKQYDTTQLLPILKNLQNQLTQDFNQERGNVQELLKQVLAHVGDDVKAILSDPASAAKIIQDNWNTDHNQFVSQSIKYTSTIQKQVQDAIAEIKKKLEQ